MSSRWTQKQQNGAFAIATIQRLLEPLCDGCGYKADRPNCAAGQGGYCEAHDQPSMLAYRKTIREIEKNSDLTGVHWKMEMPMHMYTKLTPMELDALQYVVDQGGQVKDKPRFEGMEELSAKDVIAYSSGPDFTGYKVSYRGQKFVKYLKRAGILK